LQLVNLILIWS